MKYLMLINEAEADWADLSDPANQAALGRHGALGQDLAEAGVDFSGGWVETTEAAHTIRKNGGGPDKIEAGAPFATPQQLTGFYLLDLPSDEAALEWAAKIPVARAGAIEVRPLRPMQQ